MWSLFFERQQTLPKIINAGDIDSEFENFGGKVFENGSKVKLAKKT